MRWNKIFWYSRRLRGKWRRHENINAYRTYFVCPVCKAAWTLVDATLEVVPGPPPDPSWADHLRRVLEHTILRVVDQTRGSLVKLSGYDAEGKGTMMTTTRSTNAGGLAQA